MSLTLRASLGFQVESIKDEFYQKEYLITGGGYKFHLVINKITNTKQIQVLGTETYAPPNRCIEYLYYEADSRLGLDAIDEFFEEQKKPYLADKLRQQTAGLMLS